MPRRLKNRKKCQKNWEQENQPENLGKSLLLVVGRAVAECHRGAGEGVSGLREREQHPKDPSRGRCLALRRKLAVWQGQRGTFQSCILAGRPFGLQGTFHRCKRDRGFAPSKGGGVPGHRPPPPEAGRVPNTKHTFQMDTLMEAMQWGFQKSHFEASQTPLEI